LAARAGAPLVAFVESGGARLQEGHAALGGYGRIFRASVALSSRAPQLSVVTGVSAGGGAYSPALTDFVLMTERARMFLTGPKVVRRPPASAPVPTSGRAPDASVPAEARRVYDVREVAAALADGGELLELSPRWARNMVTALARIEGRPVGIVANQPRHLGGVIDAAGAEKAALFVRQCDRFRLPLVVLVDTPGFMPGRRQEAAGVIR